MKEMAGVSCLYVTIKIRTKLKIRRKLIEKFDISTTLQKELHLLECVIIVFNDFKLFLH